MKINLADTAKLTKAISAAEGKSSARTITAEGIQHEAKNIQSRITKILAKKDWVGAKLTVDLNAQTFPAAYKYSPESTIFTVERFASGWFVTDIRRGYTRPNRLNELTLSDEQKQKMVEFVIRIF